MALPFGPERLIGLLPAQVVRLAWLYCYAKGTMQRGDLYRATSIIGSEFLCSIADTTVLGNKSAPSFTTVTGRAWITGIHQHTLDSDGSMAGRVPPFRYLAKAGT